MSNMFQMLGMMAVPAAILLFFRYLNVRSLRQPIKPSPSMTSGRVEGKVDTGIARGR
jgi:hypothetical protein